MINNNNEDCRLMRQELTGDNRKWLVHPKVIEVSKEELIKHQLRWILDGANDLNGDPIKVNDTELIVLAYVYLHGRLAIEECVRQGIYKNKKSVENCISTFRTLGVIEGVREDTKLNPGINLSVQNISLTIKYKLKSK